MIWLRMPLSVMSSWALAEEARRCREGVHAAPL